MDVVEATTSWNVNLMTALIGVALLCMLSYNILGRKEPWDPEEGAGLLGRLKKRRDRLLRGIKDLEFEKEAGSISQEEFHTLRNEFKRQAIAVSKDLERVRGVRLRNLLKKQRGIPPSQRKRVEDLVRARAQAATAPSQRGAS